MGESFSTKGPKKAEKSVYLLWFVSADEEMEDGGLLIGVYETKEAASAAVDRLRDKPGFSDYPEGFQIHTRQLGQDSWTYGFVRD